MHGEVSQRRGLWEPRAASLGSSRLVGVLQETAVVSLALFIVSRRLTE